MLSTAIRTAIAASGQDAEDILALNAAILGGLTVQAVYTDSDGVVSLRNFVPYAIERGKNDQTIVRCYDLNRLAPRSFRLVNLVCVTPA